MPDQTLSLMLWESTDLFELAATVLSTLETTGIFCTQPEIAGLFCDTFVPGGAHD